MQSGFLLLRNRLCILCWLPKTEYDLFSIWKCMKESHENWHWHWQIQFLCNLLFSCPLLKTALFLAIFYLCFFLKKCQILSFKSKKHYLLIFLCVKSVLPNNVQYIYVCTTWSQHCTWKWIHMTAEVNSHILNNRSSQSFSEDCMDCSSAFPAALPYFSFLNIGIPRAHAWSISSTSHPVHSEGCVLVPYICQVQFIKSLAL